MVPIIIGYLDGGMEVKSSYFEGWVSRDGNIPADNNAYVYTGTGTGQRQEFLKMGFQTIKTNGGLKSKWIKN
jgi:hypothetical protein